MGRVKSNPNLTDFTRQNVEAGISKQYALWFKSHASEIVKLFETYYLPAGTADDDHLAWLQFAVDVKIV